MRTSWSTLTPARGLLNAFRDWLFFKLCGFKDIVGTPLSEDLQTCRKVGPDTSAEHRIEERECERLARCLQSLGPIDLDDPDMWDLRLTESELRAAPPCWRREFRSLFRHNMRGQGHGKGLGLEAIGSRCSSG